MAIDDAHTSHSHGFELPETPLVVVQGNSRRWRALAGVAVCLGLVGVVTGLIVVHRQSVSDEHLTSDALQREELRDGWRALGAAAAQDARNNDAQLNPVASAPPAAPPNVVIVNVPAQGTVATPPNVLPSNVTNINLPSGAVTPSNGAPTQISNVNPAPIQSLPPINFSPVEGYVPPQAGYAPPPASEPAPSSPSPQNSYGTTTGSIAPITPGVGNGSIPGSSPNPALPNNGLVGSAPVPSLP